MGNLQGESISAAFFFQSSTPARTSDRSRLASNSVLDVPSSFFLMFSRERVLLAFNFLLLLLFVWGSVAHASRIKVAKKIKHSTSVALAISSSIMLTPFMSCAISSNEVATKLAATQGASVQTSRRLGLVKGTLQGCSPDENCFSTSARSAGKRVSPWTYEGSFDESKPDLVWSRVEKACQKEGLTILQSKHDNDKTDDYYLLAAEKGVDKQPAGSSLFYEFTLRPLDKVVLVRAFVDKTVFVYPIQQPVSDFGALKGKLEAVQKSLGMMDVNLQ